MNAREFLRIRKNNQNIDNEVVELLEEYGNLKVHAMFNIDPPEDAITPEIKANLIAVLYDIIHGYTFSLPREARHGVVKYANETNKSLKLLIRNFDSILGNDKATRMGVDSDHLRSYIERFIFNYKSNQKTKN